MDIITQKLIELDGKGNRLIQLGYEGSFCVNNDCPLNMKCFRYDRTDNFQKYEYKRFDWKWKSPMCNYFIEMSSGGVILNSKAGPQTKVTRVKGN